MTQAKLNDGSQDFWVTSHGCPKYYGLVLSNNKVFFEQD